MGKGKRKYRVIIAKEPPGRDTKKLADKVHDFCAHPFTSFTLAVVLAGVGASGKASLMISNIFLIAAIPIVWLGIIRARFKWYLSTPLFIVVLLVMGAVIWWANAPNMSPSDADLMRSVQAAQKKIEETNKEIQRLRGVQEKMANILTREASSSQLQRLAKEYDCGFVLIAFSGEVGGTMAKAYASEIECNWRRCLIVEHQLSGMCIKVPELSIREGPSVLSYKDLYLGLPAEAGQQQRAVACGDIGVFVERLRTEPIGTCAVIGFKKIDANS